MRLRKVKIENFTSHVKSDFDFLKTNNGISEAAALIIVRAENGTGKTQLFKAISWAIWGAKLGLGKNNNDTKNFLSPEWMKENKIHIKVEIEYEIRLPNDEFEIFSLTRRATETIDPDNPNSRAYGDERVTVAELTKNGYGEIGEEILHEHFPHKLKDIFIMDGESTDNLLRKDANTSASIKKIVTNLLGIDNAEKTLALLKELNADYTKQLKGIPELNEIAAKSEKLTQKYEEEDQLKKERADLEKEKTRLIQLIEATNKNLIAAGAESRDGLVKDLEKIETSIVTNKDKLKIFQKDLLQQLQMPSLGYLALSKSVDNTFNYLNEIHEKGEIPKTAKPILIDCLEALECVCGSSLNPADKEASTRIDHINQQIEKHKLGDMRSSYLSESITVLKEVCRITNTDEDSENYESAESIITKYTTAVATQNRTIGSLETKRDDLRDELAKCDKDKIAQYSQQLISHEHDRKTTDNKIIAINGQILQVKKDLDAIKSEVDELKDASNVEHNLIAKQNIALVAIDSLIGIKKHRQEVKRKELSDLIGELFVKLIGSEEGGMYAGASIDESYNLVVKSANGPLNATWVLNGASLRMLAVTFIWSVTKLTGDLEANKENSFPRIFDTPTGMISGITKKAYYDFVCDESTKEGSHNQLVLLTTKAEREGCYEILNKYDPKILTISSNHMPEYMANPWPETTRGELLSKVCECNSFGSSCEICTRKESKDDN